VLAGRDALVVMPTGAGKSLCYQLPALVLPGVTVVVSPLIALMKDQVDDLVGRRIPATFINSTLGSSAIAERLAAVRAGRVKLIYVAPERFYDPRFLEALTSVPVSLFAVDEAHCISEWGHDFRPSYLSLRPALARLGSPRGTVAPRGRPPVLALTATATPDVRDDITAALGLTDPYVLVSGFDRPNLRYGVIAADPMDKLVRTLELVQHVGGPTIVYAGTRDAVDRIIEALGWNDIVAAGYHAGMAKADRDRNQERFMADEVPVMVATNAFGLGVDKANVRLLVHFDMPGTLEAYYQEAGRAGRDGREAFATLLYHPSDRYLREFFLQGENPSPDLIRAVWRYLSYQASPIYATYGEILDGVGLRVPELAIGTALTVLERAGYVRRPRGGAAESFVRAAQPFPAIAAALGPRAKVQREVWAVLQQKFGSELEAGVHFSAEEVVRGSDVTREGLARSLRALADKQLLVYEPPFRGQEIRLLRSADARELEVDWVALQRKREREEAKLNRMEAYATTTSCRRAFILEYFGDPAAAPRCDACDNCLTR
jgi:ATP-dependent DNA helicase RecQ